MAKEPTDPLRDWHRLFGLLLTDYFTGSPFRVEIEADLSLQRQFLDVLILRRFAGAFADRLPDGMEDLAPHNLVTFKSHREWLYDWVMKELIGHYVAYRKLVSRTPTELLPEDQFRLYAVTARFPSVLSRQVPWHERGPGVYDCQWGRTRDGHDSRHRGRPVALGTSQRAAAPVQREAGVGEFRQRSLSTEVGEDEFTDSAVVSTISEGESTHAVYNGGFQ